METRCQIDNMYAKDNDITFIVESMINANGEMIEQDVVGFYYGEPSDEKTSQFYIDPSSVK